MAAQGERGEAREDAEREIRYGGIEISVSGGLG